MPRRRSAPATSGCGSPAASRARRRRRCVRSTASPTTGHRSPPRASADPDMARAAEDLAVHDGIIARAPGRPRRAQPRSRTRAHATPAGSMPSSSRWRAAGTTTPIGGAERLLPRLPALFAGRHPHRRERPRGSATAPPRSRRARAGRRAPGPRRSGRHAVVGCDPALPGIGAAPARSSDGPAIGRGRTSRDIAALEIVEAFAAQTLAVLDRLGIADDDPRCAPTAARWRSATRGVRAVRSPWCGCSPARARRGARRDASASPRRRSAAGWASPRCSRWSDERGRIAAPVASGVRLGDTDVLRDVTLDLRRAHRRRHRGERLGQVHVRPAARRPHRQRPRATVQRPGARPGPPGRRAAPPRRASCSATRTRRSSCRPSPRTSRSRCAPDAARRPSSTSGWPRRSNAFGLADLAERSVARPVRRPEAAARAVRRLRPAAGTGHRRRADRLPGRAQRPPGRRPPVRGRRRTGWCSSPTIWGSPRAATGRAVRRRTRGRSRGARRR